MNVSNNWNIIDGNIFAVEFHSNSHKEKSIFYNIADITQRIFNIIIINIHTNVIVIPRRYLLFVVDLYYGMKLANDNE